MPWSSWLRLEPIRRDETLALGLQAPVADPLWMLARQLVFGEFAGQDAGSPISAQLQVTTSQLTKLRVGTNLPIDIPKGEPLELLLESEPPGAIEAFPLDAARAGLEYLRRIGRVMGAPARASYAATLAVAYPLPAPVDAADTQAQAGGGAADADAALQIYRGKVPDGSALYDVLSRWLSVIGSRPPTWAMGAAGATIAALSGDWLTWCDAVSGRPFGDNLWPVAWQPQRLEYAAEVAAAGPGAETIMSVALSGGSLDWFDFDVERSATTPGTVRSMGVTSSGPVTPTTLTMLPATLSFPGLPNSRFWAFEDAAVNFGAVNAPRESALANLVVEFAVRYGNDHYLAPLPLPLGTLCTIDRCVVTDTFGHQILIRSLAALEPAGAFRVFEHSQAAASAMASGTRDPLFCLFATLDDTHDGEILEQVTFARDELADLVWSIERTAPGVLGVPLDRDAIEAASAPAQVGVSTATGGGVELKEYQLRTALPRNWFPFMIPADDTGTTLQFAPVEPLDLSAAPQPWGAILTELSTAGLPQEEVTRAGVQVKRYWRYARWTDGRSFSWVARADWPARGTVDSGLGFDLAVTVDPQA